MGGNLVQILVGIAIGLGIWGVKSLLSGIAKRRGDRVRLDATLQMRFGPDAVEQFGFAPCMAVRIVCRSRRPAKIASVCFAAALERFEVTRHADGARFVGVPVAGVRPKLSFDLLPLQEKSNEQGWVLERDDVAHFLLPAQHPALPFLRRAPSEHLLVDVHLYDGSLINVFSGLRLLNALRQLAEESADADGGEPKPTTAEEQGPLRDEAARTSPPPLSPEDRRPGT